MDKQDIINTCLDCKVDDRVKSVLDCVVNSIDTNQKGDYNKIILTMLVPQLILYFRALDEVNSNEKLSTKDNYLRTAKSPEIQVLQKCNDHILSLLDKLAISPLEKAKVKKLNKDEESAQELLDELIK